MTLAVVCDGCGSCLHSEVGAKIGAKLWISLVREHLSQHSKINWQQIQQAMLVELKKIAQTIAIHTPLIEVIKDYFLFTLLGVVITPDQTTIISLGDGVIAVNEELTIIPDYPNNAPPYLAYQLFSSNKENRFKIHCQVSTGKINSLLIGTDGLKDVLPSTHHPVSKTNNLTQFWQNDGYFKNPDLIRRHLFLMNRETIKPNWERQTLEKKVGQLSDDTTIVVMRRNPQINAS